MNNQPPTPVAGPASHLPVLDGVRGLAILLVLFVHLMLFNDNSPKHWVNALSAIRGLGWMGVDLFFVLSGFLITGILYDTIHQPHYFRNFYMRRFLRIFPLYYGFLLLLLALTPWLHVIWGGRQFVLLAYMQNTSIWFPVDGFHPAELVDLNHFWSLAVEEQFYFVWPMLVFLVKDRKKLIQLALLLSAGALALRIGLYLHGGHATSLNILQEWTLCRVDTLMMGGCLALLLRGEAPLEGRQKIYRHLASGFFWMAMLVMAVTAVAHPQTHSSDLPFVGTYGFSMLAVAFAGLIYLALAPGSLWGSFFRMAWLRSLGKYSYGIYVLHILVGHLFGMGVRVLLGESLRNFLAPRLHSRVAAGLIEFFLAASVVYAAAWLSYNLYEVHFLRLKKFFSYRPKQRKTVPQRVVQPVGP